MVRVISVRSEGFGVPAFTVELVTWASFGAAFSVSRKWQIGVYCACAKCGARLNLVPRARARLGQRRPRVHGLWDNQQPEARLLASGLMADTADPREGNLHPSRLPFIGASLKTKQHKQTL